MASRWTAYSDTKVAGKGMKTDMRQRLRGGVGALGVMLLLLAACGNSEPSATAGGAADEETTVEDSAVNTTNAPDDPAESDSTAEESDGLITEKDPAAPIAADAVYDPSAEPIMTLFSAFEPGTYRTGAHGTPMSFTTAEALSTQSNRDGAFVLTDVSSRAPDDRDLVFIRVGAFSDPAAPNAPMEEQTVWPNDDFLGWLDNLHEGVIATGPVETTVNGLAAIRVDLELSDDIECGWLPGLCVGFVENNGQDIKALNKGASYRVWVVDQGTEDPLAIVAGIANDDDAPWFQRADAVMDTLAFGDIAPNPVQQLAAGPNSLNVLGNVDVDLPDDISELTNGRSRVVHRWTGRLFSLIPITGQPAAIYFAERPHDLDGNPLATTGDVVSELRAGGAEVTELESATIDGVDARVFDVTSADVGAILLRFSPLDTNEEFLGWDAPAAGRIWLIEHPDRGLKMISTHAFENVDDLLPQVNELGEAVVESLTFTS